MCRESIGRIRWLTGGSFNDGCGKLPRTLREKSHFSSAIQEAQGGLSSIKMVAAVLAMSAYRLHSRKM